MMNCIKLWIKSLKNLIKISNKITNNGNNENLKENEINQNSK